MFTIPAPKATIGGAAITVSRPSASSGTITNPTYAYDLIASRPDDYPYSTSADRALYTGSPTAGIVNYETVEYNTFASEFAGGSLLKLDFSDITLGIVYSSSLTATVLASSGYPGFASTTYVCSSLDIDYQVDGTNWVNLVRKTCIYAGLPGGLLNNDCGPAANVSAVVGTDGVQSLGSTINTAVTKEALSISIPSSSFSTDLNNLKVRFVLGTCKNSTTTTYQSSGSYNVWDIRANIS